MALVELQALEKQVQDVEREEHRLSLIEQRLSTQIEAYFAHQEIIAASYSAAEARVQLQEALTGVSEEMSKLGRALERAEQQSEHMQARAAAIDRLVEEGILDTPALPAGEAVARQLARLDMDTAVEEQLASLKRQLE
jgi:phage shock protein A